MTGAGGALGPAAPPREQRAASSGRGAAGGEQRAASSGRGGELRGHRPAR